MARQPRPSATLSVASAAPAPAPTPDLAQLMVQFLAMSQAASDRQEKLLERLIAPSAAPAPHVPAAVDPKLPLKGESREDYGDRLGIYVSKTAWESLKVQERTVKNGTNASVAAVAIRNATNATQPAKLSSLAELTEEHSAAAPADSNDLPGAWSWDKPFVDQSKTSVDVIDTGRDGQPKGFSADGKPLMRKLSAKLAAAVRSQLLASLKQEIPTLSLAVLTQEQVQILRDAGKPCLPNVMAVKTASGGSIQYHAEDCDYTAFVSNGRGGKMEVDFAVPAGVYVQACMVRNCPANSK